MAQRQYTSQWTTINFRSCKWSEGVSSDKIKSWLFDIWTLLCHSQRKESYLKLIMALATSLCSEI